VFSLALYLTAPAVLVLSHGRDRARSARTPAVTRPAFTGLVPTPRGLPGLLRLP